MTRQVYTTSVSAARPPGQTFIEGADPHSRPWLPALANTSLRIYLLAQAVSYNGTWMYHVAVGWLAMELTGSPLIVGAVTAARALPIILLVVPAGVLADRLDRRLLIIAASLVAMSSSLVLAWLALSDGLTVGWLIGLSALTGLANAIEVPTFNSFVGQLAGRRMISNAIALNAIVFNLARLSGPAAAGLIIAGFGAAIVFVVNALTYAPLVVGLLLIPADNVRERGALGLAALRQAGAFVRSSTEIRGTLLLLAANSLLVTGYLVLAPAVADLLAAGPEGVGFLFSGAGAGALIAGLLLALLRERPAGRDALMLAAVCTGVGQLLVAVSGVLPLSIAAMALAGGGMVAFSAISNAQVQVIVPDALRGRVMGFYALSVAGLVPLAAVIVGMLAEAVGTSSALGATAIAWLGLIAARQVASRRGAQLERSGVW